MAGGQQKIEAMPDPDQSRQIAAREGPGRSGRTIFELIFRLFYLFTWLLLIGWLLFFAFMMAMVCYAWYAAHFQVPTKIKVDYTMPEWVMWFVLPPLFALYGWVFCRYLQRSLRRMWDFSEATTYSDALASWNLLVGRVPIQLVMKDQDRLCYRQKLDKSTQFFGAIALPMGLFAMIAPSLPGKGTDDAWIALPVGGGAIAIVGVLLLLGRRGITIDIRQNQASLWWGLVVPLWSKTRELSRFSTVHVDRRLKPTEGGPYPLHRASLTGDGNKQFTFFESPVAQERDAIALQVAEFLGFDIVESSGADS